MSQPQKSGSLGERGAQQQGEKPVNEGNGGRGQEFTCEQWLIRSFLLVEKVMVGLPKVFDLKLVCSFFSSADI